MFNLATVLLSLPVIIMKNKFNLRRISQFIILVLILYLAFAHQKYGIEKAAPIDSYCPFGAVESFFTFVFTGEFLKRIYISSFILGALIFVMSMFFGRIFCSFICPLGTLQEWIRLFGTKIGVKKEFELPVKIDKYARYIKYIFLVVVVYYSYVLGDLIFRNYDPFNALSHLGEELAEKWVAYALLLIILIISLFSKNIWCRYLCPFGAFLGILNKISFFKIAHNKETCISCSACTRVCPAALRVGKGEAEKNADCISCMQCVEVCPNGTLVPKIFGKKISAKTFIISTFSIFFVALIILTSTSMWQTKPNSNITENDGVVNVDGIRGSNTLEYVIRETGVPFEIFQSELNLPNDTNKHLMLREIGVKYNLKNEEGNILETEDFRQLILDYFAGNLTVEEIQCSDVACPFGEVDDHFPGKCALYEDNDHNGICDLSE